MEPALDITQFRQSDLPNTSFQAFVDMRQKGLFCDLTLRVQDHTIAVHRVVVAAVIPYFRTVLSGKDIKFETEETAMGDFDPTAVESLIHFAYTGEVEISSGNVNSLLMASQFLLLSQVQDACVEFLSQRLSFSNVIEMRTLGLDINNLNLIRNCDLHIRKNFEEYSKTDYFRNLSDSYIKEIIAHDELIVSSEEIVLDAVMNWVKFSPSERHVVLPDLLTEVRLIYILLENLMNLVSSEELIRSSIPCRDVIDDVKNYHFSKGKLVFPALKTEPRKRLREEDDSTAVCREEDYSTQMCSGVKNYIVAVSGGHGRIRMYFCDLDEKKWKELANKRISDPVSFAVETNEKIYVFLDRTILVFYPETSQWELLESCHQNIQATAVVSHKNVIYCFDNFSVGMIHCFDAQQNKWLKERLMSTVRIHPGVASMGDSIYVTGGRLPPYENKKSCSVVEKYNPSTGAWSAVSPMLSTRYSHGSVSLNGKIYVCGGFGDRSEYTFKTEVYDPLANQWNFIPSMPCLRNQLSWVSLNGKIYASGESYITTYDPEKKAWDTVKLIGSFPFLTVVVVPLTSSSTGKDGLLMTSHRIQENPFHQTKRLRKVP